MIKKSTTSIKLINHLLTALSTLRMEALAADIHLVTIVYTLEAARADASLRRLFRCMVLRFRVYKESSKLIEEQFLKWF